MTSYEIRVAFTTVGCFRPGKMHPGCILPVPDWITTNSASVLYHCVPDGKRMVVAEMPVYGDQI